MNTTTTPYRITFSSVCAAAYPRTSHQAFLVHAVDRDGNALCGNVKPDNLCGDMKGVEQLSCKKCRTKMFKLPRIKVGFVKHTGNRHVVHIDGVESQFELVVRRWESSTRAVYQIKDNNLGRYIDGVSGSLTACKKFMQLNASRLAA